MKKLILTLILAVMAFPVMAQEPSDASKEAWLKTVETQYVCMVNNQSYDSPQIAVEVEGKTYYGCCSMCKDRLEKDPAIRAAIDPVSGNSVNKAEAIIGADVKGKTYYFENMENFSAYANGPMPAMPGMSKKGMDHMDMMDHENMDGMDMDAMPESHDGHQ